MSKKYIVGLAMIMFGYFYASSQAQLEYSENYTISDGLAHNGVTDILEDSKGYLWISTYDGLNKYDGYEFETFRNTINKDLFSSNRIRCLMEDKKGNIWVGTDEGVSIYNYQQQSFKIIALNGLEKQYATDRPELRKLIENKEAGKVVCATENGGILVFNQDYTFDAPYIPPAVLSRNERTINFLDGIALNNSTYLFATNVGLITFNLETQTFNKVLSDIQNTLSLESISENRLVICVAQGIAVVEYSLINEEPSFKFIGRTLRSDQYNCSFLEDNRSLWLGSTKSGFGVKIHNVDSILNEDYNDIYYLAKDEGNVKISAFYHSINKGCWMGTFNRGIMKYNPKPNPFTKFMVDKSQKYGMHTESILNFCNHDENRVYFLARNLGIYLFNTTTQKFEPLPFDITKEMADNVKSIYRDARGNTWLTIRGKFGLYRIKPNSRQLELYENGFNRAFLNSAVRGYAEDKKGNIWIEGSGAVYRVSVNKTNEITKVESLRKQHPFFINKRRFLYRHIFGDRKYDQIWLGSATEGLFRIKNASAEQLKDVELQQFIKDKDVPYTLPSNAVTSVVRLGNGQLWLGTEGGGISKVVEDDKKLQFFPLTEIDGLSNNVVKGIVPDRDGNLWVTTNIGLNKFNPLNNKFITYRIAEGLPFENFWYANTMLDNGILLVAGTQGLCYFNPKDIHTSEDIPRLELGDLKLFNKSVLPGDTLRGRVLLNKRLADMDEIVLKHNENVFSIEIKSLHFSTPTNHFIKYQLLPINQNWIEVPANQRYVHNNGLPAGEYTLKVMASNSFDEWTVPKELRIIIKPPFWKTWYAIVIYVIFLGLITYVVFLFFHKVNDLKHNLEIEHLEKENEKNINDAKLRFFSNISHEIKTPLTLISGPINLLIERYKSNREIADKLHLVQRQSRKISRLIDQVHDFQRSEAKLLDMNYSHFNFDDFMKELVVDFEFLARTDGKELEIEGDGKDLFVYADKDKLEKVFNNLLNNAFKFTKEEDKISISYKQDGNKLELVFKDTGKGIDLSDLPHIFKRFYQSKKKGSEYTGGSGIGLAFSKRLVEMHYGSIEASSKLSVGTEFHLVLPIVKERTSEQQEAESKVLEADESYEEGAMTAEELEIGSVTISEEVKQSRIFFAEDNTDMRQFVLKIMSNFFEVRAFENGQGLLNAMKEEWPDIIVSDVLMPEVNGFELCRSVKTDIKTSHIPVVLLTACTAIDDQIQGLAAGADAYIKKPFNTYHLLSTIQAVLKNRKNLRERFQIEIPLNLNKVNDNDEDSVFIEKLYKQMDENLDNQNVDFNEMARQLYLNRTHFYQKVKAITNQTPFELIRMYRITKAAEFLSKENLSVNEVFMMTGFKSRSHFTKLFKEKYNVTPGKYASEALKEFREEA